MQSDHRGIPGAKRIPTATTVTDAHADVVGKHARTTNEPAANEGRKRIITEERITAMTTDTDVATNAGAIFTTTHRADTVGLRLDTWGRGADPTCGVVLAVTIRTAHIDG